MQHALAQPAGFSHGSHHPLTFCKANDLKADALGFLVLATLMLATSALAVVRQNMDGVSWLLICVFCVPCAEFIWRHKKAPKTPGKWFVLALISLAGALFFYGGSRLIALAFFNAEPDASRVFDIILTLMIAPGLTFICVAGGIRAFLHSGSSNL